MRRNNWVLIILVITMCIFSSLPAYCYSGNDLVEWMKEYDKVDNGSLNAKIFDAGMYMGYIIGVQNCLNSFVNPQIHFPDGVTNGQLCSIVSKYLKDNPEQWNLPADILVYEALYEAFN